MAAYPEQVDAEHLLRQIASSPNRSRLHHPVDSAKPGAVTVLEVCGERGPGRPLEPEAVTTISNCRPAEPAILPQASLRCQNIDSQLVRVIKHWPELPASIRAAMLAMIEAASGNG